MCLGEVSLLGYCRLDNIYARLGGGGMDNLSLYIVGWVKWDKWLGIVFYGYEVVTWRNVFKGGGQI